MGQQRHDDQTRRPHVHVPQKPAEWSLRHYELNARIRLFYRRPVVKRQENAGHDEDHEQEIGDASERVFPTDIRGKTPAPGLTQGLVDRDIPVDFPVQKANHAKRAQQSGIRTLPDVVAKLLEPRSDPLSHRLHPCSRVTKTSPRWTLTS